ncbi:DEAD/DEAH box helicase domain protein [Nitrosococcus halophilus Nc 4]|uniref:DEAD/DEAH box helicase domain protein n=1 Tax=Nitrosococcus halophilus (strain Nc4) TaxID=472759 RepID=D5BYK0_NITHN|nr:DEAD/DEAH box helicase [Nitrosococcus halophilus]ADE15988.1 DEAD/DEAH box helicase domain protein [Nitrosococcus halophilus Nc 4]
MALTIARHCVAQGADGLSPLQAALLHAPERVRIADAPTGAGKTFAFQRAVMQGQRVLFIVPTRRLAQNIAAGLIRDLTTSAHWPREKAESKVEIWSSDRTVQLLSEDIKNIAGHRIRQIRDLDPTREGGEMIIAVPEVISHLLLRPRLDAGQAATGVFDLLRQFDHIVFDEFHTIEARGFGLAALCARLASAENPDGSRFGRAKVSFLSATPLDIQPVLERLGVPAPEIAPLRESLTGQGRPVHGDVSLSFTDRETLAQVVEDQIVAIAAEVEARRQVVLIYNRLGDLIREMPDLIQAFAQAGIPAEQVLVINSIADSGKEGIRALGYRTGRSRNPDDFSVLVATASVEVGVTFREANLMLMEPGFAPMNFLQRYGRAARRGADGRVIVRHDPYIMGRNPWIRDLLKWALEQDGERVDIQQLTERLSAATQKAFEDRGEDNPRFFGALPNRAVYTAGLYWNALMGHKSNRGPRYEHLRNHQPPSAGAIRNWLHQVRAMEQDRLFGANARRWCERFERQAYVLRDIAQRVRVVQGDGNVIEVDPAFLERETTILDLPMLEGPQGQPEVRLQDELEDHLRDQRQLAQRLVTVYFPHTGDSAQLSAGEGLVDAWCRALRGRRGPSAMAWDDYPEAMAAAEKLVRLTGLVPSDDDTLSLAASHCVL